MFLFFAPDISNDAPFCLLSEEESYHCTRVLRLKEGDPVRLTNGKGTLFEGILGAGAPKSRKIIITKAFADFEKRMFHLHIAIAPTKNINRFEWFLEKATEIGIDEITPVICDHAERVSVNTERMSRLLIAAIKQSGHTRLPVLNRPTPAPELIKRPFNGARFIASYKDNNPQLAQKCPRGTDALILIGPEGDFSERELSLATQSGFAMVNLGDFRLRTETAALFACSAVNLINLQ
jgi:16S rRNA (uracil1498-N3)-methyltransferase